MDDERNYIEQCQARALATHGTELTSEEMARDFARLGFTDRIEIIDALDRDERMRDEPLTVREAARRRGSYDRHVSALRNTHHALRKVER